MKYKDWTENLWKNSHCPLLKLWKTLKKALLLKTTLKNDKYICLLGRKICWNEMWLKSFAHYCKTDASALFWFELTLIVHPLPVSLHSNRSRTPPIFTYLTCLCRWMSRSWRTCWSLLVTSFPRGYWGMPMALAEELALPGTAGYLGFLSYWDYAFHY